MSNSRHWDATDEFVLSRWAETRDLSVAFHNTTRKLRRRFRRTGQQLEPVLKARGYNLKIERNWAEYKAYRPEWITSNDDPLVVVAVGGLFPVGYLNVEEPLGYLALYFEGFEEDKPGDCSRFADLLYEELHGLPSEWQNRTNDENWTSPLFAALADTDDSKRISLARDPTLLKAFALQQFEKFFAIAEPITKAVRRFASK